MRPREMCACKSPNICPPTHTNTRVVRRKFHEKLNPIKRFTDAQIEKKRHRLIHLIDWKFKRNLKNDGSNDSRAIQRAVKQEIQFEYLKLIACLGECKRSFWVQFWFTCENLFFFFLFDDWQKKRIYKVQYYERHLLAVKRDEHDQKIEFENV